ARGLDRLDARAMRELRELALVHHHVAAGFGDLRVLPARIELEQNGAGIDLVALGYGPAEHGLGQLRGDGDAVPLERADERLRVFLRATGQRQGGDESADDFNAHASL